jgi:putative thioredoxin
MQWMSEASAKSFAKEVLERSATQLVLVDFWAAWCQPCRVLGPVLEAAVEARGGRVWLVKVDTAREPSLAAQFRVQAIPAVKAFLGGRQVDEFVGLRDRRSVDAFLDRLLPSGEETALQQAALLLGRGEPEKAAATLGPALESPRHREDALLLRARCHVALGRLDEAERDLAAIAKESLAAPQAALLSTRVALLRAANGADLSARRAEVEQRPEDSEARWMLAGSLLARGQPADALEQLLELLQRDRAYRDDAARRAMLAVLDEVGADHDLAREYRRRMQIYL